MKIFVSTTYFDYSWNQVTIANWCKYSRWNSVTPHVIAVDTLSRHVDPSTGILRTERLITCRQAAPRWVLSLVSGWNASSSPSPQNVGFFSRLGGLIGSGNDVDYTNDPRNNLDDDCSRNSYVYEASYVDLQAKTLTMCSMNLTWTEVLSVRETAVYRPASGSLPADASPTLFEQRAQIIAHSRRPTVRSLLTSSATTESASPAQSKFSLSRFTSTAIGNSWDQGIRNVIEQASLDRFRQNAAKGHEALKIILALGSRILENNPTGESGSEATSSPTSFSH